MNLVRYLTPENIFYVVVYTILMGMICMVIGILFRMRELRMEHLHDVHDELLTVVLSP